MTSDQDRLRPGAEAHPYLLLNPRGRRKAPRRDVPYEGKPTLHAPGRRSLVRTGEAKPIEVPAITLRLFDREVVLYCRNCLVTARPAPGS